MNARFISADSTHSLMQTNRFIGISQQTNIQTSQSQKVIIGKKHPIPHSKKPTKKKNQNPKKTPTHKQTHKKSQQNDNNIKPTKHYQTFIFRSNNILNMILI